MIRRIIAGIDGSKESFESYRNSVSYFQEEKVLLEAVFVVDERKIQIPFIYSGAAYDIAYERLYIPVSEEMVALNEQINKELTAFGEKCLDICRDIDLGSSADRRYTLLRGDPSEELLDFSVNYDLIVLGQRGENAAFKGELIGSTAEEIVRRSTVPVLIIPENIPGGDILIVYDGGKSSDIAFDYYIENLINPEKNLIILVSVKKMKVAGTLTGELRLSGRRVLI